MKGMQHKEVALFLKLVSLRNYLMHRVSLQGVADEWLRRLAVAQPKEVEEAYKVLPVGREEFPEPLLTIFLLEIRRWEVEYRIGMLYMEHLNWKLLQSYVKKFDNVVEVARKSGFLQEAIICYLARLLQEDKVDLSHWFGVGSVMDRREVSEVLGAFYGMPFMSFLKRRWVGVAGE